jgi:hypothetical protein
MIRLGLRRVFVDASILIRGRAFPAKPKRRREAGTEFIADLRREFPSAPAEGRAFRPGNGNLAFRINSRIPSVPTDLK